MALPQVVTVVLAAVAQTRMLAVLVRVTEMLAVPVFHQEITVQVAVVVQVQLALTVLQPLVVLAVLV